MALDANLVGDDGEFAVPDPTTDVAQFIAAHNSLTNIIESALSQAQSEADERAIAEATRSPFDYPDSWRLARVATASDPAGNSTAVTGGSDSDDFDFARYDVDAFLTGLQPVDGTEGVFYEVERPDGSVPALVYPQPTVLDCVDRLHLATTFSAGPCVWPTYALGRPDGEAYLIVNLCMDLAETPQDITASGLQPAAAFYVGIQWAE